MAACADMTLFANVLHPDATPVSNQRPSRADGYGAATGAERMPRPKMPWWLASVVVKRPPGGSLPASQF